MVSLPLLVLFVPYGAACSVDSQSRPITVSATVRQPSQTAASWTVKRNTRCSRLYTALCRHRDRVENAYSAVSVNLVTVLAGDKFRLIEGIRNAVCSSFPNRWLVLSICKHKYTKISNALKTWSQWTFAVAVNIGSDSNLSELLLRRSVASEAENFFMCPLTFLLCPPHEGAQQLHYITLISI